MKSRFVKIIAVLSCAILLLSACGDSSTSDSDTGNSEFEAETVTGEIVNIHILMNDTKDFQASIKAFYEKWASENSDQAEITIYDAEGDVNTQVSQCDMALTKGADAIVIVPVDSATCDAITEMCEEESVPLICGQNPADSGYDIWVGSDHTNSGIFEAEYVVDQLEGEGDVVILYGSLGNDATNKRWDGAKSVLEKYEGINILAESTANWIRDEAMSVMENWLQSDFGDEIDAVIAGNDEMAIGAALAAADAGRKDIIFAGVDASSEALEFVADDEFNYFTVLQDGENICKTACEWAVRLANGESVEKETYVDVPYVPITKDNVEDYR